MDIDARLSKLEKDMTRIRFILDRIYDARTVARIVANSNGTIVEWNEGATLLFGYGEEEAKGKDIDLIIPAEFRERHHAAFAIAVIQKKTIETEKTQGAAMQFTALCKDGNKMPISIWLTTYNVGERYYVAAEALRRV